MFSPNILGLSLTDKKVKRILNCFIGIVNGSTRRPSKL